MKYEIRFRCGKKGGIGEARNKEELLKVMCAFLSVPELSEHEMVITVKGGREDERQ